MKCSLSAAMAAALVLAMLILAPPASAEQSLTFNVDLANNCAATPSGGALSLRPGETLTITVVATGIYPDDTSRCRTFLTASPNGLSGWIALDTDLSAFPTVLGAVITGAGTTTGSATVGTVSARLSIARFAEPPSYNNTLLGFGNSPIDLNVIGRPGSPQGPGTIILPPVEHTLGFNANGGTCTITNSGLITDGAWIKVPTAEQCSRPGFTLLGWNPKPDGSDPLGFDPGGWTVMTDDNVLYAIWVPVR